MKQRVLGIVILCAGIALLVALALASQGAPVSTFSTFDTGPNGYRAAFEVLRREGVDVTRLQQPLGLRDPKIRTLAATSTAPERSSGEGLVYDANDYKRLAQFERAGGRIVYFTTGANDPMRRAFSDHKLHPLVLDARDYTNRALSTRPAAIERLYDALALHGRVAFDERLHGYAIDRSAWSVFPWPVRASLWIVVLAVVLVLIDANVRTAPPIVREPPPDRDSAAYISSMAALLRRARARHAAIARFAKNDKENAELQRLASLADPTDRSVLQAAILTSHHRKDLA